MKGADDRCEMKSVHAGWQPYMLNTRNKENNTAFYSYVTCFVNTCTVNMYASMS